LAKIATPTMRDAPRWRDLDRALARRRQHGTPGCTSPRMIASGDTWTVADVVCTSGPDDRPFEEQHSWYAIAVVLAGTFEYRSPAGHALMTPGSLLLGNHGQCFDCGHAHGEGDRCVSFWFAPDHFERLAADAGARRGDMRFTVARVPPLRDLSPLTARAALGIAGSDETPWEELSIALAARTLQLSAGVSSDAGGSAPNAEARVAQAVRTIDRYPADGWTLGGLAQAAGLSRYHFLRTFDRLIGVTPHQYVLRARLRDAALRLVRDSGSVLDIALDCGFGDVSNFNRAFRREFGMSPGDFRRQRRLRR
jgi:AraC family transcriptional regulator